MKQGASEGEVKERFKSTVRSVVCRATTGFVCDVFELNWVSAGSFISWVWLSYSLVI